MLTEGQIQELNRRDILKTENGADAVLAALAALESKWPGLYEDTPTPPDAVREVHGRLQALFYRLEAEAILLARQVGNS